MQKKYIVRLSKAGLGMVAESKLLYFNGGAVYNAHFY
jgi:hypothetical protein